MIPGDRPGTVPGTIAPGQERSASDQQYGPQAHRRVSSSTQSKVRETAFCQQR